MYSSRNLLLGTLGVSALSLLANSASAGIIIDDDINASINGELDGDNTAEVGTITTAWTGWAGMGSPGNNYWNLLDPAKDEDAGIGVDGDALFLEALNGEVPVANIGTIATVTYGGTVQAGTYTLQLQVVNYANEPFPDLETDFAGLTATSSVTPVVASGDDEVWTYTYVVGLGDAAIGSDLSLALEVVRVGTGTELQNLGVDHVTVDFAPVPEPGSLALLGMGGLMLIRRRRAK